MKAKSKQMLILIGLRMNIIAAVDSKTKQKKLNLKFKINTIFFFK